MPRHDFKPAKLSRFAVGAGYMALPLVFKMRDIRNVIVSDEDLAKLRQIEPERAILLPNHPTNTEPAILFELSRRVDEPFYYVCCREAFDHFGGVWGRFIQRLGAYSLVRGALDRASFSATRKLLTEPKTKLVIFPEGEVYSQNDSLLPFQSGVIQLAFWGVEDLRKVDPAAKLYLVPVAIRYRFVEDMKPAILQSLARLERALKLETDASHDSYTRLRTIGETVVAKLQDQYKLKFEPDTPLGERMDVIKRMQLERAAERVGVKLKGGSLAEEMRVVVNALHHVTEESTPDKSEYDRRLAQEQRNHIRPALHELERLANWIAVYDGYVAANPSPERMAHVLVRLEVEVLGRRMLRGEQDCYVRVGDPIDLATRLDDYTRDKRGTVAAVTEEVEASVQAMLDELGAGSASAEPADEVSP